MDATGSAHDAASTFFCTRMHHHGQKPLPLPHWLKWVVAADWDRHLVLSQLARLVPWNDCANLSAVVAAASRQTRIGLVPADAEFDSERNHTYIRTLSARAPGRSLRTRMGQARLFRWKHRRLFLKMSTEP